MKAIKANSIKTFIAPSYSQDLAQPDSYTNTKSLSSSKFLCIPMQSRLLDTIKSDKESKGIGESETL